MDDSYYLKLYFQDLSNRICLIDFNLVVNLIIKLLGQSRQGELSKPNSARFETIADSGRFLGSILVFLPEYEDIVSLEATLNELRSKNLHHLK